VVRDPGVTAPPLRVSDGLDSATTLDLVRSLRTGAHLTGKGWWEDWDGQSGAPFDQLPVYPDHDLTQYRPPPQKTSLS